jgi:outer membrane lipoprotein SlyB
VLSQTPAAPAIAVVLATAYCLGGCAGADSRPIVDMRGHSEGAYDCDIAPGQASAHTARDNGTEAEDAGIGALAGGGGAAVLGAIGGNPLLGAGVGALAGLAGTAGYEEAKTETREERLVRNCMRARGYTILG